ncbi:phosphohydrolase [Deinococcus hohokamensis]|uniref:Phosphohydrolase n=1 Tax=Deinococcus hohokamensis TaxID=309883 RepID=A0ABV9IEH5_9DEIO
MTGQSPATSSLWALTQQARLFALPFYAEPHRAYHNAAHVRDLLVALGTRGVLSPVLALAVWGHDLIYDPRSGDNEARSAQVFDQWLAAHSAPDAARAQVQDLILATRHVAEPEGRDAALLVDADLSILGAEPARFAAYDGAIRREYAHVPDEPYRQGRLGVLQAFLRRERLFTTPEFAALEAPARANLHRAVAALEAGV